jgi:hypothetical protein
VSTLVDGLRQQIAARATQAVQDHSVEWIDKALESARRLLPPASLSSPIGEAGAYRLVGDMALRAIEAHKGELAQLGPDGLALTMTLLAQERLDEAVVVFLRDAADWDAIHEASEGMANDTVTAKREREAKKAAALATLRAIGGSAARYALPLLLSVLSIAVPKIPGL